MARFIWHVWSWIVIFFIIICALEIAWEILYSLDDQSFNAVAFIGTVLCLIGLTVSIRKVRNGKDNS